MPHAKPYDLEINMPYFPNIFILLGAWNARFPLKHTNAVVNYTYSQPQALKIWAD